MTFNQIFINIFNHYSAIQRIVLKGGGEKYGKEKESCSRRRTNLSYRASSGEAQERSQASHRNSRCFRRCILRCNGQTRQGRSRSDSIQYPQGTRWSSRINPIPHKTFRHRKQAGSRRQNLCLQTGRQKNLLLQTSRIRLSEILHNILPFFYILQKSESWFWSISEFKILLKSHPKPTRKFLAINSFLFLGGF